MKSTYAINVNFIYACGMCILYAVIVGLDDVYAVSANISATCFRGYPVDAFDVLELGVWREQRGRDRPAVGGAFGWELAFEHEPRLHLRHSAAE